MQQSKYVRAFLPSNHDRCAGGISSVEEEGGLTMKEKVNFGRTPKTVVIDKLIK